MSTTTSTTSSISTRPAPPSALPVGLARTAIELKMFFRDREALIFIFFFPVLLLGIFTDRVRRRDHRRQRRRDLGGAVLRAGDDRLRNLPEQLPDTRHDIALERDDGTLKRLRGTPMPPLAYFLGKIGLVIVTSVLQIAILLGLSATLLDVDLPTSGKAWMTFAWIFLLGSAGGTVLGIAFSVIPKSARSAAAIVTPIVLILQFISGVFFVFYNLPSWMQQIGARVPAEVARPGHAVGVLPRADGRAGGRPAPGSTPRPRSCSRCGW